MKIIQIILGKPNPNTANGVNKLVHEYGTELHKKQYDIEVWAISDNDNIKHKHTYKLKVFKNNNLRLLPFQLKDEILKHSQNETVFHFHSVFIPELYQLSKFLNKHKFKYILSPHSGYSEASLQKNSNLKKLYINLFEKTIVKNAYAIHVNNSDEVNYFSNNIKNKHLIKTPNGFRLEDKTFACSEKIEFCIGFMGRFSIIHKGLDLLLKAFDEYILNHGNGKLILIGNGDLSSWLDQVSKITYSKIVIYEPKFGSEKEELLNKMSFFIHSSRWEGFPLSLLDAAANSVPLIVSKATNFGDYVEKYNAGIVLEENDVEHIKNALFKAEQYFKNGTLKELSFNAFNMVKNEFDWGNIVDKLVEEGYKRALQ